MRTDASSSALSTLWQAALEPRGARVRAHLGAGCIARAHRARARCGSARSAMRRSCAPRGARRIDPGAQSNGKSSSASSPAAIRTRVSRASTVIPAAASFCSPHARRDISARAAARSACCCRANGSSRTYSRPWRTASTCSPCPGFCGRSSAGTGRGSGSCPVSPRGWRAMPTPRPPRTPARAWSQGEFALPMIVAETRELGR